MKSRANHSGFVSLRLVLAILPLSAGLFVSSQLLSGCQPGTVDCDAVDCDNPTAGAGGGGSGGGGSGGGGSGGGGSGGGGSGGGGSGSAITAETPVADCASFGETVGDVETKFFPMKCGTAEGNQCHGQGAIWGDFSKPPLFSNNKAMTKTSLLCSPEKIVNTSDSAKSVILTKVTSDTPKCDNGDDNGTRMPVDIEDGTKTNPLSPDEIKCLTAYAKAISGGK